jgi:hypothetical protein
MCEEFENRLGQGHRKAKKMNKLKMISFGISAALLATAAFGEPITSAGGPPSGKGPGGGGGGGGDPVVPANTGIYYNWMSSGITAAWNEKTAAWKESDGNFGYNNFGLGVTISVIDDHNSRNKIRGDLGDGSQRLTHGNWTSKQANMIAPLATMNNVDFGENTPLALASGFNVINLSFRENEAIEVGYALYDLEKSIIDIANRNDAFVAKSAGNGYGAAVGGNNLDGGSDYLSKGLIAGLDAQTNADIKDINNVYNSTIFVGAIDLNVVGDGSVSSSQMAVYSNVAGDNRAVQRQFLVVGVESTTGENSAGTGLSGTSFAAPIVAGYGAILSSKFTDADPAKVAGQLLRTARIDSFGSNNYKVAIHGQGEADIALAISPISIN